MVKHSYRDNVDTYTLLDFHKTYLNRSGKLNKKDFKNVMKTFLKHALNGMLEGKPLNIGYGVGQFKIIKNTRTNLAINWYESNKYRQQLIDEGKKPYDDESKTGYKWFIYFTDSLYYRFYWDKIKIPDTDAYVVHNILFYQLKPYAKTKIKLTKSINELSPIIHNGISANIFK